MTEPARAGRSGGADEQACRQHLLRSDASRLLSTRALEAEIGGRITAA